MVRSSRKRPSVGTGVQFLAVAAALFAGVAMPTSFAVADPSYVILVDGKGGTYPYDWRTTYGAEYVTMCVVVDTVAGDLLYASEFDFLLCANDDAMSFVGMKPGEDLPVGWEYLSYRTERIDTLCANCPTNSVRLAGQASAGGGALPLAGCIAELVYYVGTDCYHSHECYPIEFCILDCGDNVVLSSQGDSLFTPSSGYIAGVDYDSSSCNAPPAEGPLPVSCLSLERGAICNLDFCEQGDMNLNAIHHEIGDAVFYSNYFIYGETVFDPVWKSVQVQGSDYNNDGVTLTLADLVYLIWIIGGELDAYPPDGGAKVSTVSSNPVEVELIEDGGMLHVRTTSEVPIGGVHLIFEGAGTTPGQPIAGMPDGMLLKSHLTNGTLRIAIHPDFDQPGAAYAPGQNDVIRIPVESAAQLKLVTVQISDRNGQMLGYEMAKAGVPDRFTLSQNFPNPFNAATIIPYALLEDAWVSLDIVDILGRTVARPLDEYQSAGSYQCAWRGIDNDGQPVASGMYFYRLVVGDRVATRKMVLLK